jgi:segregation and condensation protein A
MDTRGPEWPAPHEYRIRVKDQPEQPASDASAPIPSPPAVAASAAQREMPWAMVRGQPMLAIPQDLYIPPDALEIILEAFEGPLDLLLYLIRRQNLDILDIPVAEITRQYVEYIQTMQDLRFELAADYLVMAAMLAEIKSRLLLPRPVDDTGEEVDPRAELVRRLQEYERFKKAASDIDALSRLDRDTAIAGAHMPEHNVTRLPPPVDLREMLLALRDVLQRAEMFGHHSVRRELLSVRERMGIVLRTLGDGRFHDFTALFTVEEGRLGVVVTFLAILELAKELLLDIVQEKPMAPIYVKSLALVANGDADAANDDALNLSSEFDDEAPANESEVGS